MRDPWGERTARDPAKEGMLAARRDDAAREPEYEVCQPHWPSVLLALANVVHARGVPACQVQSLMEASAHVARTAPKEFKQTVEMLMKMSD